MLIPLIISARARARGPLAHFVPDTVNPLSRRDVVGSFARDAEFYFAASSRFTVDLYRRRSAKKTTASRRTSFLNVSSDALSSAPRYQLSLKITMFYSSAEQDACMHKRSNPTLIVTNRSSRKRKLVNYIFPS